MQFQPNVSDLYRQICISWQICIVQKTDTDPELQVHMGVCITKLKESQIEKEEAHHHLWYYILTHW